MNPNIKITGLNEEDRFSDLIIGSPFIKRETLYIKASTIAALNLMESKTETFSESDICFSCSLEIKIIK